MLPSVDDRVQRLAITAQALYLANLTVLPVLGFMLLLGLHARHRHSASELARGHLRQAIAGSLWAGGLLVCLNAVILLLGGYHSTSVLVVLVLYFFTVHSLLILLGMIGLAKAMAGKPFRYPLIGASHDGAP